MTFKELISSAGIPKLDAELLLAHATGHSRSWIMAHENCDTEPAAKRLFRKHAARRRKGEPLAYITGKKDFFGREFRVTKSVLIPRPCTELLVELAIDFLGTPKDTLSEIDDGIFGLAKRLATGKWTTVVDIGTGSGCIAISLALEMKLDRVIAVDVSKKALNVASENACEYGCNDRISFIRGDGIRFLKGMNEPFMLISNPPYLSDKTKLDPSVSKYEPAKALFSGPKGLDVLLPLSAAARQNPFCKGIILELRKDQVSDVLRTLEN